MPLTTIIAINTMKLKINSDRGKDINGYIAPFVFESNQVNYDAAVYPIPIDNNNQDKAHRSKFFVGTVDLTELADGLYVYKSALFQSRKCEYGYIRVEDGDVTERFETLLDMRMACLSQSLDLAELYGSEKQVNWASSIRINALLELKKKGVWDGRPCEGVKRLSGSAKWWIDNRAIAVRAAAQIIING